MVGFMPRAMRVDRLLSEHGIGQDSAAGRPEFERQMERRRLEAIDQEALKPLRRSWHLGSEQFKEQMLELMEGKLGESHSGELHRETAEQRANRIIAEELARRGWQESEWATRRRSDPGKLASAARLRSETTLPIKWIAARVQIGTAKGAKTNAKPQAPSNHATSPNSNLRFSRGSGCGIPPSLTTSCGLYEPKSPCKATVDTR